MNKLPDGWTFVSLGQLGQWGSGGTPTRTNAAYYNGGTIPWLVIGDLTDGYVHQSQTYITQEGLNSSSAKLIPVGTLLVAMYGSIGKLGITATECATNQAIAFCRVDFRVVTLKYLFHALYWAKPALLSLGQGGAQQNISQKVLKNFQIQVAPLKEQTRIADQLDILLARVNACNSHLEVIPDILKRFRRAVLRTAMSGVNTSEWQSSTIGQVALNLRYGTSKKCDYRPDGMGVLRIPNITAAGIIDAANLKRAEFDKVEIDKLALEAGDLLVIRSNGSLDLVGKCGLVTKKEAGLLFAGYLIRLRINPLLLRSKFVHYWLMAPAQREKIEILAKSTSGVNNLNAEELKSIALKFPALHEQDQVIQQIEQMLALVDHVRARHVNLQTHAQRLAPQLLAKAFRGELLEQNGAVA